MKLNLGCNKKKIDGYINIDIDPAHEPDIVCDVVKGLPYDDSTVDEVRAFDFLEHIPLGQTMAVVNDIWRVLKPGGLFESFTPDAEYGQGAFQDPTHVSFWTEGSWLYFSHDAYRAIYNTEACFTIKAMQRVNTDPMNRIFHLHVMALAVKGGINA